MHHQLSQKANLVAMACAEGKPAKATGTGGSQASQRSETQQDAAGSEGEEGEPPKDERNWLQKNWMILLPLGFVVSVPATLTLD